MTGWVAQAILNVLVLLADEDVNVAGKPVEM
jgi:hypothetical protein